MVMGTATAAAMTATTAVAAAAKTTAATAMAMTDDHNPPPPHHARGPERWRTNAIVRIILVAIGQRALEIGETMASVGQWVLFDGRRSIIVHKAVAD